MKQGLTQHAVDFGFDKGRGLGKAGCVGHVDAGRSE